MQAGNYWIDDKIQILHEEFIKSQESLYSFTPLVSWYMIFRVALTFAVSSPGSTTSRVHGIALENRQATESEDTKYL